MIIFLLIIISYYDIKYFTIPDKFIVSIFIFSLLHRQSPISAILDAMILFGIILILNKFLRFIVGKNTIGFGDHKLIAVIAAYTGCQQTITVIFVSAILGCCFIFTYSLIKKIWLQILPFAPFLTAGWILIEKLPIWNNMLNQIQFSL